MNRLTINPTHQARYWHSLVKDYGSPLCVIDCWKLLKQYQQLCESLPGVRHFYAVKALPEKAVLKTLALQDAGFDICSLGELELLQSIDDSSRAILHTHPIKKDQDISSALRLGCKTFVVDNPLELEKFKPYRHQVALLLRLSFPNPNSPVDLSAKFGCPPQDAALILKQAQQAGIAIKGFSFHAGSQCPGSENHVKAIQACCYLLKEAARKRGDAQLNILNIGGGFPVQYCEPVPDLNDFCQPIRQALADLPDYINVQSEPGRILAAPAATCISTVVGSAQREKALWYYLDDGLYGSYSGQMYDHARYPLTVFGDQHNLQPSVFAGPTCDSIDVIARNALSPRLNPGDLVLGKQMGAYTLASATNFNHQPRARVITLHEPTQKHPKNDRNR